MERKIEWRHFFADEIRAVQEADKETKIEGYPAMFDRFSEDLGGFVERIAPGAFRKTLRNGADVRALWNHDHNYVLGRTKSGTLKLVEDKKGLRMVNRPPDTQWARDLMVSIGREDVTQMSFGFWVVDEEWKQRKGKPPIRTLKEVELVDVSVVTYPAYPDTEVALRSMEKWQNRDVSANTVKIDPETFRESIMESKGYGDPEIELITVKDGEDIFSFRDFEQFERVSEKITELRSESTPSRDDDEKEGVQSQPNKDLMQRLNKRLRESDWQ